MTTGDAARLSQVFGNLLGNALKFTDRGGTVRVRLFAGRGKDGNVLGPRLRHRHRPGPLGAGVRAVRPGRSVDRAAVAAAWAWGLHWSRDSSNSTAAPFVRRAAGTGTGTEVTVELPLIEIEASRRCRERDRAAAKTLARRVLVIEDNEDSAESLQMYLELLGHEVTVAHSGPDAIRIAETAPLDVIVCDIGLPGMSGHEVCARLRVLPLLSSRLIRGPVGSRGGRARRGIEGQRIRSLLAQAGGPETPGRGGRERTHPLAARGGYGRRGKFTHLGLVPFGARPGGTSSCSTSARTANNSPQSTGLTRCSSNPARAVISRAASVQ